MMTVGSLFAGIGGFDLGFERAGFEIKWQIEIDEHAVRILQKHWPNVTRYADITKLYWGNVELVDVMCGGFPCQPVSQAGLGRAQDDERWLWPSFYQGIRILRPRYVVVENVPGLLRNGIGDVLGDLAAIGYDAEWDSLPAAAFGAPHIRDRVWILAYPSRQFRNALQDGCQPEQGQRPYVLPQRDWAASAERSEYRELVSLVPGVHSGVAADWWRSQSGMARSVNGLPGQMDRVHGLGNAIVPQIAEWIAHRIKEAEAMSRHGAGTKEHAASTSASAAKD